MELVKNYDCSIHYYSSIVNVVADVLSRKAPEIRAKMQEQSNDGVDAIVAMIIHV